MIFNETRLNGVYVIELEKLEDERGFFTRSWDKKIFDEHDINSSIAQCSISFNKRIGTLRGMHYQTSPYQEDKLIRCTRGKAFEVIIDLRKDSNTYLQWESFEISSESYKLLYVPKGFAFGFQTLEDNTEIFYQISQFYMSEYGMGIRWDDPTFGILWPLKPTNISKKDMMYKNFDSKEPSSL